MLNTLKYFSSLGTYRDMIIELVRTDLEEPLKCAGQDNRFKFANTLHFWTKGDWCYSYNNLTFCNYEIAHSCKKMIREHFNGEADSLISPEAIALLTRYVELWSGGSPSKKFEKSRNSLWIAKQSLKVCQDMQALHGVYLCLEEALEVVKEKKLKVFMAGLPKLGVQTVEADSEQQRRNSFYDDVPFGNERPEHGPVHEELELKISEHLRVHSQAVDLAGNLAKDFSCRDNLSGSTLMEVVREFSRDFYGIDTELTIKALSESTPEEVQLLTDGIRSDIDRIKSMVSIHFESLMAETLDPSQEKEFPYTGPSVEEYSEETYANYSERLREALELFYEIRRQSSIFGDEFLDSCPHKETILAFANLFQDDDGHQVIPSVSGLSLAEVGSLAAELNDVTERVESLFREFHYSGHSETDIIPEPSGDSLSREKLVAFYEEVQAQWENC